MEEPASSAGSERIRKTVGSRSEQVDDFTPEEGAIRVIEEFPLDIFTQMSGYRYEDLESMTATQHVGDHAIRHLNIEGLITLKEESLRHKDQMDVAALRRIQEQGESDVEG